jgi:hypothetical protein
MYHFTLRYNDGESPYNYISDYRSLFTLAWMFEHNERVISFTVSSGGTILSPRDFGYGELNNWKRWKTELFF